MLGSFLAGNQHEQKTKKPKPDQITVTTVAAYPISAEMEDYHSPPSFRGESWSALAPDSRSKPTDINVTLPAQ